MKEFQKLIGRLPSTINSKDSKPIILNNWKKKISMLINKDLTILLSSKRPSKTCQILTLNHLVVTKFQHPCYHLESHSSYVMDILPPMAHILSIHWIYLYYIVTLKLSLMLKMWNKIWHESMVKLRLTRRTHYTYNTYEKDNIVVEDNQFGKKCKVRHKRCKVGLIAPYVTRVRSYLLWFFIL